LRAFFSVVGGVVILLVLSTNLILILILFVFILIDHRRPTAERKGDPQRRGLEQLLLRRKLDRRARRVGRRDGSSG
jgi:hypothetical protein